MSVPSWLGRRRRGRVVDREQRERRAAIRDVEQRRVGDGEQRRRLRRAGARPPALPQPLQLFLHDTSHAGTVSVFATDTPTCPAGQFDLNFFARKEQLERYLRTKVKQFHLRTPSHALARLSTPSHTPEPR